MRYEALGNVWSCADCGSSVSGYDIAARRSMSEEGVDVFVRREAA
jgi:hypothetical protein